jgi:hypothetical protein
MSLPPAPPPPFLPRRDTFSAWGFDHPDVECTPITTAQADEVLRDFLLYAQARSRGKPWSATGVYNDAAEPLSLTSVLVEFEAHHRLGTAQAADESALMHVHYVLPVTEEGALYSHSEGSGLLWLDFLRVCAFCPTQAEAVCAIEAVASYVEIGLQEVRTDLDHYEFFWHTQACLALEEGNGGGDPVRVRALRRRVRG